MRLETRRDDHSEMWDLLTIKRRQPLEDEDDRIYRCGIYSSYKVVRVRKVATAAFYSLSTKYHLQFQYSPKHVKSCLTMQVQSSLEIRSMALL